jgi:hypothetical protein
MRVDLFRTYDVLLSLFPPTALCVAAWFTLAIDLSPYEWNFDLDKSGQKFHHSLKEHHKISNIPKFRCEML